MNDVRIKTIDGTILEEPSDFKYLGSWVDSTASDIKVRKAMAWKACNAMNMLWRSPLDSKLKIRLFECTVESVLLYGCETWTLTLGLQKELDGCYTRLLRKAKNVHWSERKTNQELYGDLPTLTDKIRKRRLKFAGHCHRNSEDIVSKLVLWTPRHGKRKTCNDIHRHTTKRCPVI